MQKVGSRKGALASFQLMKGVIPMFQTSGIRPVLCKALALCASVVCLSACGGGGGSPGYGPVVSTLSFPLQTAYRTAIANGGSYNFSISGSCTGTGSQTRTAANTPTVFEGAPALSAQTTLFMAFSNCSPGTVAGTVTDYYDSHYLPLGHWTLGSSYGVYLTAPVVPVSVMVGNVGTIGTETLYTDNTKTVPDGRSDLRYAVEADTATTAIISLTARIYNASGTLTATEQDRFRITAAGTLTPVSTDLQYWDAESLHLVLTF